MNVKTLLSGPENFLLIVSRDDLIEFALTFSKCHQEKKQIVSSFPENEIPITQSEAVEFLGKSRQTIVRWRKMGIIKGYLLGGRIYFFKSELLEALKKQ